MVEREWEHGGLKCVVALDEEFFEEWFSGYVAIPKGHPCWGKGHNQVEVSVHGGLTFAKQGSSDSIWKNKDFWWFGFHCAHATDDTHRDSWDFERTHPVRQSEAHLHKWTIDEVCAETEKLADQLANVTEP
jgi:hypothetical protein